MAAPKEPERFQYGGPYDGPPLDYRRDIGPRGNIDKFEPTIDGTQSEWTKVSGGGGGTGPYPFDVEFSAGSDADHRTAFVRPGTLNGLVPTDMLDTYDLDINNTYYLVLSGVAMDGEISSCTLEMEASAPGPMPVLLGEPPTSFDYVLGLIIGDGVDLTWYRTIGNGSLIFSGSEVFRVPKATPTPGTLPYDLYWTWLASTA